MVKKGTAIFLCHKTGRMAKPWAEAGFNCICVDIAHSIRIDRVEGNIRYVWGDVRSWCPPPRAKIVFVCAEPPCFDVTGSGAQDWSKKGNYLLTDALQLFTACQMVASWSGAPWMIENPVGALSRHMRDPDFTFHPWEYAGWYEKDNYVKRTCLWTGGGFIMPAQRPALHLGRPDIRIMNANRSGRRDTRSVASLAFARACFEANRPDRDKDVDRKKYRFSRYMITDERKTDGLLFRQLAG